MKRQELHTKENGDQDIQLCAEEGLRVALWASVGERNGC